MKKALLTGLCALSLAVTSNAQAILGWDFTGQSNQVTAASTFADTGIGASVLSRGAGAAASTANNSFRTTGFQNNGISLANTDYFEFTLTITDPSLDLALASIDARFAGTAAFSAAPGVEMAYAYSLDGGASFTLLSSFTQIGNGASSYDLTGVTALQSVTSANPVTFRFFASGQTTTGGWGYNNLNTQPGQAFGLVVNAVPEPSTYALLALTGGALALYRFRTKRRQS
jgi:hypothetical protein